MTLAETRDRRVIRDLISRDHAVSDILDTRPLNAPRRALPTRVRVDHQADHHRRLMRRAAMTISAVGAVERAEIHLLDRPQHEPRQMILR